MTKIAWIIDSSSNIDLDFAKENCVHLLPLNVIIGDKTYKEHVELSISDFFKTVSETNDNPKTSQPAPGEVMNLLNELKENYDMAIVLTLSSALSGTHNTIKVVADDMSDFKVEVIDSGAVIGVMTYLLKEGLRLEKEGKSPEEIIEYINQVKNNAEIYAIINELDYLHRGGRVSGTGKLIGSILNIKPLLKLQDGKIEVFDKVRGEKKAKNIIFKKFEEFMNTYDNSGTLYVDVVHADAENKALEWKSDLEEKYPTLTVNLSSIGPTVATHTGPNAVGLIWLPVK